MSSIDINVLNSDRVVLDTVSLDEGQVVIINGEGKEGTAGGGKDAEPVALATLDIDHSEGNWGFV